MSRLKPGSVHDEVTVTSNAVLVDQVSSSLGYVTGATQILELPTGRSPYSLMTLSPGVIATGNSGTGPIVSGGRSNTSAILLDGQDTRNNSTLDNAYTPPQETVQEVRFITNNFSAEYGRSAGGVLVAAGKTGANQVHGSVYDYLKNDKLNANSWANNRNNVLRGRQRHNEYGFTLSGPVYHSEGLRRAQQDILLLQLGTDQRSRRQHPHRQRARPRCKRAAISRRPSPAPMR